MYADVSSRTADKRNKQGHSRIDGKIPLEITQDDRVGQAAYHTDKQPWQSGRCLCKDGIGRFHILGDTRCQLVIAFGLFTYFVHNVVDSDATYQSSYAVNDGQSDQVIFFDRLGHCLDRIVGTYRDGVFLHDMLYLRSRGVGNHFFQREYPAQFVVIVYHIHIIYLVHVFGLAPHFLHTLGHAPVFVYDNHFGSHETASRVFVVFQEVDYVAGLFGIVDMGEYLLLRFFIEVSYQVYGIVGIEVVDILFGDGFARHLFEEFFTVVLIEFHQYIGGRFLVE